MMGKIRFINYCIIIASIFSFTACSTADSTIITTSQIIEIPATATASETPQITLTPTPMPMLAITPTPGEPGFCELTGALDGKQLLIGYIPDYRTLEADWGNCLTDIIYSSIDFYPDGSLNLEQVNTANLETMQEIKEKYGTRIHISIGGMNRSGNFSTFVTNISYRSQFVENLNAFAEKHQLNGIDLDWEFPETEDEIRGYIALMYALQAKGLLVSVALYPYPDFDITPYLAADRILLMSYERGKRHSTYQQAVKDLDYFSSLDVPKDKLYLGIPMYGRQMDSPYHYFAYSDIVTRFTPVPYYINEVENIYFNNTLMVERKTCYVIRNGYGGVMLWELGQDNGDLLKTIYQAIVTDCE